MNKPATQRSRLLGTFTLPNGQQVRGELRLRGRQTDLRIRHGSPILPVDGRPSINGETDDLYKVSCIDCAVNSSGSGFGVAGATFHYTNVFPHFVTIGRAHLDPDLPSIKAVHFRIDDMESVFYDFDAFGHVIDSKSLIDSVVSANKLNRTIAVGDVPLIAYFTGKLEVLGVDTAIGRVSVSHRPSYSMGSPKGVFIKNRMMVTITPVLPMTFEQCIDRVMTMHRFLSLVAGRKQGIESVLLDLASDSGERHEPLRLRWSYVPKGQKHRGKSSQDKPHPGDIPLDAVRRPEEFAAVLDDWIKRDPAWRVARTRYNGCLRQGHSYNVDRLIAAANMFDILPEDAVPVTSILSPELVTVQSDCLAVFRKQPVGIERDSVIGALKRMGKLSLPKKVLHRTAIVEKQLGHRMPDLQLVAKTAVKCRNYFVHGGSDDFDFPAVEPLTAFLTDALEFIFAASDLIEAGWNAAAWNDDLHGWGHSFARFRSEYDLSLVELKKALGLSPSTP